ncbi:TPA: integrating conjugative element protein [Pseudomonas aeruginosa]|uniref:integrating conjugative element protein n=2 Tax=Gammaproteobacteria TaxID=1236 RepID=UPI000EB47993|nr:integrating conjugative element protein [Pseudomonas aeruginosa]EJB8386784.1 integrating conjugative element protein [Pseudomonas aeruginosa]MBV5706448.1 integrating conjugative element protein [Pseudomonas aeruginosa]MBV5931030.1 integrating conjugative element protein [Pseudomonas aeruginosa]MCK1824268.1 integrating conjugative element protein [Pseudomonas aeruginosa]MDI4001520.1 integrating conjugative element protein [Pseudomonas aeruginosa]
MKKILATLAFCTAFATQAWAAGLIVVEDLGGASALPYYQGLDPQPSAATPGPGDLGVRGAGAFPVRSARLSPGQVQGRAINAPGLQPLFLVGDDTLSRTWLKERGDELRGLHAVGLAVNVASEARLTEIRAWGKGLQILPAPADDLVDRLGLRHYPALITSTAIQQ